MAPSAARSLQQTMAVGSSEESSSVRPAAAPPSISLFASTVRGRGRRRRRIGIRKRLPAHDRRSARPRPGDVGQVPVAQRLQMRHRLRGAGGIIHTHVAQTVSPRLGCVHPQHGDVRARQLFDRFHPNLRRHHRNPQHLVLDHPGHRLLRAPGIVVGGAQQNVAAPRQCAFLEALDQLRKERIFDVRNNQSIGIAMAPRQTPPVCVPVELHFPHREQHLFARQGRHGACVVHNVGYRSDGNAGYRGDIPHLYGRLGSWQCRLAMASGLGRSPAPGPSAPILEIGISFRNSYIANVCGFSRSPALLKVSNRTYRFFLSARKQDPPLDAPPLDCRKAIVMFSMNGYNSRNPRALERGKGQLGVFQYWEVRHDVEESGVGALYRGPVMRLRFRSIDYG